MGLLGGNYYLSLQVFPPQLFFPKSLSIHSRNDFQLLDQATTSLLTCGSLLGSVALPQTPLSLILTSTSTPPDSGSTYQAILNPHMALCPSHGLFLLALP
jgi:hypothetical protein